MDHAESTLKGVGETFTITSVSCNVVIASYTPYVTRFYIFQEVKIHSDFPRPPNLFDDPINIGESGFLASHRLFQVDFTRDNACNIRVISLGSGPFMGAFADKRRDLRFFPEKFFSLYCFLHEEK